MKNLKKLLLSGSLSLMTIACEVPQSFYGTFREYTAVAQVYPYDVMRKIRIDSNEIFKHHFIEGTDAGEGFNHITLDGTTLSELYLNLLKESADSLEKAILRYANPDSLGLAFREVLKQNRLGYVK